MAEDMTKLVGSAYAVLADPGRRAAYDALVETRQAAPAALRQRGRAPSPPQAKPIPPIWAGAATGWAPPAGATTESAGWHDGHAGTGPTSRLPRNNGDEYADDVIDGPWNSFPGRQRPGSRPTPAYDRYQRYPGPNPTHASGMKCSTGRTHLASAAGQLPHFCSLGSSPRSG